MELSYEIRIRVIEEMLFEQVYYVNTEYSKIAGLFPEEMKKQVLDYMCAVTHSFYDQKPLPDVENHKAYRDLWDQYKDEFWPCKEIDVDAESDSEESDDDDPEYQERLRKQEERDNETWPEDLPVEHWTKYVRTNEPNPERKVEVKKGEIRPNNGDNASSHSDDDGDAAMEESDGSDDEEEEESPRSTDDDASSESEDDDDEEMEEDVPKEPPMKKMKN